MSSHRVSTPVRRRPRAVLLAVLATAIAALGLAAPPSANAADATLSFVAAASSSGNRTSHVVRLPATVQAGDTMVLFMTTNSLSGTLGNPTGWTLLQSKDGTATRGRAWTRQATAADANANVTVTGSATIKDTMSVGVYRSNGGTSSVTASASVAATSSSTNHTAPAVAVAQGGSWLVNAWSEKSSSATTWTKPSTSTARATPAGTGGGKVSALLADSNGAVATGTAAARTATTSTSTGGDQNMSVVVSPGQTTTNPTNQPPVPSFTSSCNALVCSFNASGSTDPENNPLSFAWNFGDATTGTGATPSHTYGSAGQRTVTLTVSDGTNTAQTTGSVSPTAGAAATLSHVASASSFGNRTNHVVRLPATVQAGDRLVLFMTTNSLSGTLGNPTGWTLLQSKDGSATRGRAWTKVATAADANANVSVTSSATIKDAMSVAAYRSSGGSATVTASASVAGTTSSTNHVAPAVAVAQANSWLVNAWSEKSSTTQTWTKPAASTTRATPAATGSGKVSALLADSNGSVNTGTAASRTATTSTAAGGEQNFSVVISPGAGGPVQPADPGTFPKPSHTDLVPQSVRANMPRIPNGEILDLAISGSRVFIAGTFTSIQNQTATNTQSYAQAGLASFNLDTGLVDASFRPTFGGTDPEVHSVAVTPDGSKLYAVGTYNNVNGTTRRGIARLDLTTGAPVAGFVADVNARATEVVASNTTVFVGGRFTSINNTSRGSLAALDATTGQVDGGFVNNITEGIGVNGAIGVQRLVLTHDTKKLIVVHTGMKVAGQPRAGVAIIDTVTKQLTSWHSTVWEDNLEFVGGIQRAYGAAVSPDDSYFVVTSGSGGDRPPINDTAISFDLDNNADAEPRWISRLFDSVYSVAISEQAVYVGGHFAWNESPTANDPWPGQADIGYGTGQGLSAYALGEQVVNREHLGALNPVDGKALEWAPSSDSYEGNKAMLVTSRGLVTGGDAVMQGGSNVGRIAVFDFSTVPAGNGIETTITEPIMGRVINSGRQFDIKGTATAAGGVNRVEVTVRTASGLYLQDNLTTWSSTANTINAVLGAGGTWSLGLTVPGNVKMTASARTFTSTSSDPSPAVKKFETFNLDDAPPTASFSAPASGTVPTKTFLVTGTATDDKGVVSLSMTVRNENNRYLQDDGSVAAAYNSFPIAPDVPGALSTTWQREITVPDEGLWKAQIRASDTGGQSSLDTTDRNWIVSATAQAPVVSIVSPSPVTPPTPPQTFNVLPGQPVTFSGTATDDKQLRTIDVGLVNNSTQEYLTTNGSFGRNNGLNAYRIKSGLAQGSYDWTYTTPNLTPGSYQFAVFASDDDGLTTPQTMWAVASFTVQEPGNAPPKALLDKTGLQPPMTSRTLQLSGTATDDVGVKEVRVSLRDADTARYASPAPGGGTQAGYAYFTAPVDSPDAVSTTWSTTIQLPTDGDWNVTAVAVDAAGQYDFASTGATARYLAFPGDVAPTFNTGLLAPTDGTTLTDGKIFVSGRAEDTNPAGTAAMAKVEVQVQNSANQFMTSSGSFSNASTWVTAFLTSPGTPGSNFSYTTPIVPPGPYTVRVRGTDQHDLVTTDPPTRSVIVSHPANTKPVAVLPAPECTENICQFDGKQSTDETPSSLTYTWNYGNNGATPPVSGGTATGPNPKKTFTAAGTYTVTLTVRDQWGLASDPVTRTVTIAQPPGNGAPQPVINAPSCSGLTCNFSAVGTVDPDTGDTITYTWGFGDPASGTNNMRSGAATSHAFLASGTYEVTLTATDGWGNAKSLTRSVSVTAPPSP